MGTIVSRRRSVLGNAAYVLAASASAVGISAGAAEATLPQHPILMSAGPGHIAAMALRIKAIVDRENYLDDKRETREFMQEDGDEEDRLYDERMALAEVLIEAAPESSADALIIMMHAADRLNFGNAINEGEEIIDASERAIRRACAFLSRELGVDLVPFGSENFLPIHLSQRPVGRA